MSTDKERILQIIPAPPGWEAVFFEAGSIFRIPIPVFALLESTNDELGTNTYVVGLTPEPDSSLLSQPDLTQSFLGVSYPGNTEDWEARGQEHETYMKRREKQS